MSSPASSRLVTVALIGAGRIGRVHAQNLKLECPAAIFRAVADVNLKAAEKLAGELSIPTAVADYRAIMADPGIDAVVIASATATHAEMIEEAARRGKHIFCEKPIDLDLNRIARVLRVVENAGVKLQIGFNRRFDPSFAKARQQVVEGNIGAPRLLRITSRDPSPPPLDYLRASGGLLLDMTIHDFDMARFFTGSEAGEIFATGAALGDPEIRRCGDIDTCLIAMRMANGILVAIDNSRQSAYGYDQRLEMLGASGMVTVDNRAPNAAGCWDAAGRHSARLEDFFIERYREAYILEMRAFLESIRNNRPPPVAGRDGLIAAQMSWAAKMSLEQNRPVRAPLAPRQS